MSEYILDVLSISSAAGWHARHDNYAMPVVCFALVSTVNPEYPDIGSRKQVIALCQSDVGMNLIGNEVESHMTSIFKE